MSLMLVVAVAMAIVFVMYMRCRKACSVELKQAFMKPTNMTVTGLRYPFALPPLPYASNALEPYIDEATMVIHHTKHHQAYVDNLNKALQDAPEYQKYTLDELLTNLDALPASVRDRIRNNGGGHLNHSLFWEFMSTEKEQEPTDVIAREIITYFGSFTAFKEQFQAAAQTRFGSGWAWLCVTPEKKLAVVSTGNQDAPLAQGMYPILALDVWEHAYYLKYQNKRMDYVTAWWHVVDWKRVEVMYHKALKALA